VNTILLPGMSPILTGAGRWGLSHGMRREMLSLKCLR